MGQYTNYKALISTSIRQLFFSRPYVAICIATADTSIDAAQGERRYPRRKAGRGKAGRNNSA
eukprot:5237535-Amphidinium_carterae.1